MRVVAAVVVSSGQDVNWWGPKTKMRKGTKKDRKNESKRADWMVGALGPFQGERFQATPDAPIYRDDLLSEVCTLH